VTADDASPAGATPKLGVVVVTDELTTIDDLVDALAAQTVSSEIEVVAVSPHAAPPPREARRLAGFRHVDRPVLPLGDARAAGVREASAAIVVVGETHAFPRPSWAEHLIRAHGAGWLAVMPAIANANPGPVLSWASFLVDYGTSAFGEPGAITGPPSYHTAFTRARLLALGDRLPALLESGTTIGAELGTDRAYHETKAVVDHLNVATPAAWVHERFLGGRILASARRARWSGARTLVYLLGSPLVPVVRWWRARDAIAQAHRSGLLPPWTRTATALGLVLWGAGEAVGYAAGAGGSAARMAEYEVHKARYADERRGHSVQQRTR
jgi:hypothetical protein